MTDPFPRPIPAREDPEHNSVSEAASYRRSYSSPSGKAASPTPAPGVAGADPRQGAQVGQAATEGGSQPGGETPPRSQRARTPEKRKRSPLERERKRSHMCNVRLNDDEWARLHAAARAAHTSLPAYLVRAGLAAAVDLESTVAAIAGQRELVTELFAARRHLGQVGNNLNQVTRALNSGGHPAELDAVLAATDRAVQRVQDATDQILQRD